MYPFGDNASLVSDDESAELFSTTFIDAAIYPIGSITGVGISKIVPRAIQLCCRILISAQQEYLFQTLTVYQSFSPGGQGRTAFPAQPLPHLL